MRSQRAGLHELHADIARIHRVGCEDPKTEHRVEERDAAEDQAGVPWLMAHGSGLELTEHP